MTQQERLVRMELAAKQDRERFFKVADSLHLQPNYAEYLEELEQVKQQWRDMTTLANWPEVSWPMALPVWFPTVDFVSCWNSSDAQNDGV